MKNEKSTPERALNSEKSTLKDSTFLSDNQFMAEEKPKVKRFSLFDVVSAVGLTVLIIHLILQW